MAAAEPVAELDERFSSGGASPVEWAAGRGELELAEIYWLSTVRPDGRPHVTPLIAVWLDDAMYFTTGADERKAKNLAQNPHCILTTGCNALDRGLDVVVEGDAMPVTDDASLRRIAALYESKYGSEWSFQVHDGAFHHAGVTSQVYGVRPAKVLGFRKGDEFSQTCWRFR